MKFVKKILSLGGLLGKKKKTPEKSKPANKDSKSGSSRKPDAKSSGSKNNKRPHNSERFPKEGRAGSRQPRQERRLHATQGESRGRGPSRQGGMRSERPKIEPVGEIIRQPKEIPEIRGRETLAADVPLFAALGLGELTLAAIRDLGYQEPTDIQLRAIPVALAGRDIVGTAQTGTGKTAAFSLPIIDKLEVSNKTSVLILSPTRELAAQICGAFESFSKYSDVKAALIQGGVSMEKQIKAVKSGSDVLVATPGRLLDLIRNKVVDLSGIKYLILDEVDRMFDMGFIEDVSNIIRYCPKERQTLFFSATMPPAVMNLAKWALKDPERIEIGIIHSPAETIEHFVYPVDSIQKYDMILSILEPIKDDNIIVFTRTRVDADRIGEWLSAHNYRVSTLHSDRTQRERDKSLGDFKEGRTNILVATDIASRGLDISNVSYVINYNVPEHSEDYVHRIGRTGRAKTEGKAITLFASEELAFLQRIERFIGRPIERRKLEGFSYRNEPDLGLGIAKPKRRRNK